MRIETTKVFKTGGSQAVRIPQSMRFPEGVEEINIISTDGRLTLLEKEKSLIDFFEKYKDVPAPDPDFMKEREDEPVDFKDVF